MPDPSDSFASSPAQVLAARLNQCHAQSHQAKLWSCLIVAGAILWGAGGQGLAVVLWLTVPLLLLALLDAGVQAQAARLAQSLGNAVADKSSASGKAVAAALGGSQVSVGGLFAGLASLKVWPFYLLAAGALVAWDAAGPVPQRGRAPLPPSFGSAPGNVVAGSIRPPSSSSSSGPRTSTSSSSVSPGRPGSASGFGPGIRSAPPGPPNGTSSGIRPPVPNFPGSVRPGSTAAPGGAAPAGNRVSPSPLPPSSRPPQPAPASASPPSPPKSTAAPSVPAPVSTKPSPPPAPAATAAPAPASAPADSKARN